MPNYTVCWGAIQSGRQFALHRLSEETHFGRNFIHKVQATRLFTGGHTVENRTYGTYKNLYISLFLPTIFGPNYYDPAQYTWNTLKYDTSSYQVRYTRCERAPIRVKKPRARKINKKSRGVSKIVLRHQKKKQGIFPNILYIHPRAKGALNS